jgi:hypothetical protein
VWYFDDDDYRDNDDRNASSVCNELLVRIGNDFDDFARHLVALPAQIAEISRSAVDSGFAKIVDIPEAGSALPTTMRR